MQYNYENDDPASRFEFREEYWEQAKALIEADEARRRRRRWLLWWFFAGLLLVVAGWWWASPGQLLSKKEEKLEKIEVQSPKIDIKTHLDRNISNEESTQLPSNTEKTTSNRAGSNSSEINTNTTASSGAKHSAFSPKATHQTNSFTETGRTAAQNSSAPAPVDPSQTFVPGTKTNTVPEENLLPPALPHRAEKWTEQLFLLPLPFSINTPKTPEIELKKAAENTPMAEQIKPVKHESFFAGIQLGASAYQPAPNGKFLGFNTGVYAGYQVKNNWSLSAGASLRFQPGNWVDTSDVAVADSLKYSFGFEQIHSERRASGLLNLEFPLGIQRRWQRLNCELGIAPGLLIFALDRYKQTRETSFSAAKTTLNRIERGETAPFATTYFNTFAGAEWAMNQRLGLSLRANYRLGAIVKANNEDPAVHSGPGLDLGLRLKLF
jgi:hypothetical protein